LARLSEYFGTFWGVPQLGASTPYPLAHHSFGLWVYVLVFQNGSFFNMKY